jgi:iron complex outermembrane receptor protein
MRGILVTGLLSLIALGALGPASKVALADDPMDYTEFDLSELVEMDVVYGASRYEQKVSEAPSAVTVITADEIESYGYRTLGEILSSARGYYVTDDRNYSYVGVRGFGRPGDYNTRLLIMVDGHRINDAVYDSGMIGNDLALDVGLIRRVEVIPGPSSSLYGNSAFFGVVNIVTKQGSDIEGWEVFGGASSYEGYLGRASYGIRKENGFEILLSGSIFDAEGQDLYFFEFDDPATNFGVASGGDIAGTKKLFAKASYGRLSLNGAFASSEKGIPTAPWEGLFNDSRAKTIDQSAYIDISYERDMPDASDLTARVYYDWYYYVGDYPYDGADVGDPELPILYVDMAKGQSVGSEIQLAKTVLTRNKMILGSEVRNDFTMEQKGWDADPYYWVYQDDSRDGTEWAVYLQDELRASEELVFNVGVRHDHYSSFGGTTNPRLAAIGTPRPGTTLKFLFGRAFRAPNAYELYYEDGGISQKGNPDLGPETILTYEAVWEQAINPRLRGTVTAFRYDIDDLIDQATDPADDLIYFQNTDEIESKGIELELDARLMSGIRGRASYSFQETHDRASGARLTNSPKHLAKLNVGVPLWNNLAQGALELQYMSKRRTLAGDFADGHVVTNLNFLTRVFKPVEVVASVYNLLDADYGDPGAEEHIQDILPRDGRTFRLGMTYRR